MVKKFFKHKWIVLLLFIVVIVVFDALALNVSIVNRGIVTGIALDAEGQDIKMTTQIVLPKNGGVGAGGGNYLTMSATDKTIQGCISKLNGQLGSMISLSHTVVLIMGKQLLESGRVDLIEKLVIKDILHDSLIICMADGNASDILSAKIPFGEAASFQLRRLLHPIKPALGQSTTTLKDYIVDYYDRQSANYLPIVHLEKGEPSADQGKEGAKESDIIMSNRSAVIGKNGFICELSGDANDGLTLIKHNLDSGAIKIEGRDGNMLGITLIESRPKVKVDLDTRTVSYTIEAKVVRESGSLGEDNLIDFRLTPAEHIATQQAIAAKVTACFDELKKNNADALLLYEKFYQQYGKHWLDVASTKYLQEITCNVSVKVIER